MKKIKNEIINEPIEEGSGLASQQSIPNHIGITPNIVVLPGNTVTSLTITRGPNKTIYTAGESFNPAGMEVDVVYQNGMTTTLGGSSCNISPSGALSTSNTYVTVSMGFASDTQSITVNSAPATYTVTFNIGSGTRTGGGALTQTVSFGGSATPPTVSPPSGYTFSSWSGSYTSVTSNRTITAQYTLIPPAPSTYHTVTFSIGNGTRTGGGALTQSVLSGSSATPPTVSPPSGYNFDGWSGSYYYVTSNRTITAQYSVITHTVTFDVGDASYIDGTLTQTVVHGGTATAPSLIAPYGYHFVRWSRMLSNIVSDVTISAVFALNQYTVTFSIGDGTRTGGGALEQTITHGYNAQLPTIDPPPGHTFEGNWSGTYNGVTSNRTITAQYSIITYTVTFVIGDGTLAEGEELSQQVDHGSNAQPPIVNPPEGYTFAGWDGSYTGVNSDRIIVALWEAIEPDDNPATLSSIAITTAPDKTVYLAGETFSPTGMVVTATLSDDSELDVTENVVFSEDALNVSDAEVTITYEQDEVERSVVLPIYVLADVELRPSRRTHKELPFECSSGVGSVNTYSGRFCFNHKDVTVGAGSYVLGVAHNYNSHLFHDCHRYALDQLHMGRNWKLDIQQYIIVESGKLVYVDAAGNFNDFVFVGDDQYLDALGSGSKIKYQEYDIDRYVLSDASGNELRFNSDGRLTKIVSGINSNICKRIYYRTDGRLNYMCDDRKPSRKIEFAYNNSGLLDTIITKENGTEKHRITCTYNAGKLSQLSERLQNVTGSVSQVSRVLTKFVYDSSNNLSVVYNAQDNTGLKIETDADTLWTTDIAIGVAGTVGNEFNGFAQKASVEIQSATQYLTSVESDKNVVMCYELNDKGDCVSIYERCSNTKMSSVMPSPEGKRLFELTIGENDDFVANSTRSSIVTEDSEVGTTEFYTVGLTDDEKTAIINAATDNKNKYVMLSAWVFVSPQQSSSLVKPKLIVKLEGDDSNTHHIPIDHNKGGQWQYISKIAKIGNSVGDNDDLRFGVSDITSDTFTFYVSDFRIVPLPGSTKLYGDVNLLDLTVAVAERSVQYSTATRNLNQLQPSDSVWYVTQADIEHTLRDKALKSSQTNKRFTFYYNNLTQTISDVETLTLSTADDSVVISTTSDNADVDEPILWSETTINGIVVKKHRVYGDGIYTDYIKYTNTFDDNITDSKTYLLDGRTLETKDEYGVKTEYIYDTRGNLIQKIVSYSVNGAKMQQSFGYNSNDVLTSFTDDFGITHSVSPNTESQPFSLTGSSENEATGVATAYGYDSWLRNTSITDNNGTAAATDDVANTFAYNDENRLHTVTDGADTYSVEYDQFGNVNKLSLNGQEIVERTHVYNNTGNGIYTDYANDSNEYNSFSDKYGRQHQFVKIESSIPNTSTWYYEDINSSGTNVVNTSGARLVKIDDNLCNRDTTFDYDDNGNITGYAVDCTLQNLSYRLEALSNEGIASNIKAYKLTLGEVDNTNRISYDSDKIINPRIDYAYDASADTITYYTYDELGRIKKKSNTNKPDVSGWTFREEYGYRPYTLSGKGTFTSNVISSVTTEENVSSPTIVYSLSYTSGRLSGISKSSTSSSVPSGAVASFSYNNRGQVTSATGAGGIATTYQYDSRGNVTSATKNGVTGTIGYSYEDNDNKLTRISYSPATFKHITYDVYGNPVKYKVTSTTADNNMSWTRGNLLKSYTDEEGTEYNYTYDISGVRVGKAKKISNSVWMDTTFITDGSKILAEVREDIGTINYGYDMSGISAIKYNDEMYQLKRDVLGNVTEIHHKTSNSSVYEKVATYTYDAYGNVTPASVAYTVGDTTIAAGSAQHIVNINPFRWKGYYFDTESELYYVNGRYYDPETGRFINPKSPEAIIADSGSINGINPYILPTNHVAFFTEGSDILPSLEMVPPVPEEQEQSPFWKWISMALSALQIVVGILSLACNPVSGILMIAGGAFGLAGQILGNRLGRIGAGIGAAASGIGAILAVASGNITGIPAVIMGILGTASTALGVNEIAAGITGENYIQNLTGMSEEMYNAIFIGVNVATALGNAFFIQCFKEDTLVKTEDGDKPIQDIKVGDKVLAFDEKTCEVAFKPVVSISRNETSVWQHIEADGQEIICTPGHKFYVPDNDINRNTDEVLEHDSYIGLGAKWVSAQDLKVGDKILLSDGSFGSITSNWQEKLDTPETTYNFEVEDFHTYFVGESGVLVHNANCGVGGKGWEGDATWKANVKRVGQGGTITELKGGIPTQAQAERLILQSRGILNRAEGAHLFPNPHNFAHINYDTSFGLKSAIRITEPFEIMKYIK
jgi:RHS repeat-associated protein